MLSGLKIIGFRVRRKELQFITEREVIALSKVHHAVLAVIDNAHEIVIPHVPAVGKILPAVGDNIRILRSEPSVGFRRKSPS